MSLNPMPPAALSQLQLLLLRQGFKLGTGGPQNNGVDGDWGPATEAAFEGFVDRNTPASAHLTPAPAGRVPLAVPGLPDKYAWLAQIGSDLPLMVWEGLKTFGVHETPGPANNATILGWAKEVGIAYADDTATPWCGLWCAVIAKRAGKPVPAGPLWALNWSTWGVPAGQPCLGDVATFVRPGGGHVGLILGEDDVAFHVLGGNESDQVNIVRMGKERLHAVRRPAYQTLPASVKPYRLSAFGALSTNEA